MPNYVNASTQTLWAGLTRGDIVRPEFLLTVPDTTTPPDEMLTGKRQAPDMLDQLSAAMSHPPASMATSLLERRQNRPNFNSRISLPAADVDKEIMPSPPPTRALLSPLPAANKLHAGHTPLLPGSLSPVMGDLQADEQVPPLEDDGSTTPQQDTALHGPLILPPNPVDGAADHIALDVLDSVLNQVAREQERFSRLKDAPEASASQPIPPVHVSSPPHDGLSLSRQGSADSRRSENQTVDGVILKSPPLNFGAPLGQA
ncbi:hypothetical protein ACN47E_008459 [Coniothyrium glycines]